MPVPPKPPCRYCGQALMAKLGRCRDCVLKASLFTLICLTGLWFTSPAEQILWLTWCSGVIGFGSLLLLHLLFALADHLGWRSPPRD